jgi:D-cysteine desulfhydrase/L-cysteate sulfo-lyase
MDEQAVRVRAAGGRPHILNDNPLFDVASALAYLDTTLELLEQLKYRDTQPDALYMSSSGKGQAGLVLGKRLTNAGHAVHGVTATDEFHVPSRTAAIANETLDILGLDMRVTEDEILNEAGFVGAGYGIPTEASVEATKLFARTEGVILDPVYTGAAAACMIAHIREGRYARADTLVFVHTGGTPAVFTWNGLWL